MYHGLTTNEKKLKKFKKMKFLTPFLFLVLTLFIATKIRAQEDEDEQDLEEEIIDQEDIIEEDIIEENAEEVPEISEELAKEIQSGIVDTRNYPGRIIHRKKVISKVPAAGQPLEFEYEIWNVGNSDITDVELIDETFTDADQFETPVKVTIKKDKIAPHQSYKETHSVIPKMPEDKQLKLQSAIATYKTKVSNENDESIQFTSDGAHNGIVPLQTAAYYARNVASHWLDWIIFVAIAFPSTLLPYFNANGIVEKYKGKVKSA